MKMETYHKPPQTIIIYAAILSKLGAVWISITFCTPNTMFTSSFSTSSNSSERILFGRICNTEFWDNELSWNTERPTLTPCFADTALVWPPIILLWAFLPYYVYEYYNSKHPPIAYNRLNLTKHLLAILLVLLEFVHFVHTLILYNVEQSPNYLSKAHLLALLLNTVTNLLVIIYLHLQRIKGYPNCGVLWFYLLFSLVAKGLTIPVVHSLLPSKLWFYFPAKFSLQFLLFLACSRSDCPVPDGKVQRNQCPRNQASIPSKLVFWWYNPLLRLGYRRALTIHDLWLVRPQDSCQYLMRSFQNICKHDICSIGDGQRSTGDPVDNHGNAAHRYNVWKILPKMFWRYFLFPTIGRLCTDILQLANPIVLRMMIDYSVNSDVEVWHGFIYSLTFFMINLSQSLMGVYQQHRFSALALRIRSVLIGAIYRKSLVLANDARKEFSTGDIVNLMAVDSQRIIDMVRFIHNLWTAPILIGIGFYLLWGEMGSSVAGGFIIMFSLIPIQGWVARTIKSLQVKQMHAKDQRLRAINELLNGIKIMKLYAWETAFIQRIHRIRLVELARIRLAGYVQAVFVTIAFCSPFMITFTVFAVYTEWIGGELTSEKAFVTIALFNMLRVPLTSLPNMLNLLILNIVSIKRIIRFLNADEVDHYVQRKSMSTKDSAIEIKDASFSWDRNSTSPTLANINLSVKRGKLIAVVGQVGSGKSSLLSAMLGEMRKQSGQVMVSDDLKVAYVAQQAWIQNLTARENILFGSSYEPKRYQQVINACALESDFKMLGGGDQTEIGEKGINLSGGQKQRISIARACYSNADLYYFDDPLSAVDSHVGKHIFEKVLSSDHGILRQKTRILVTNALFVLPMVDEIVLLKNGRIAAIGSREELMKENEAFRELVENYDQTNSADSEPETPKLRSECRPKKRTFQKQVSLVSVVSDSASIETFQSFDNDDDDDDGVRKSSTRSKAGKLVDQESMETGKISWKVYKNFIDSLTPLWFVTFVTLYFSTSAFQSGANFWLSAWTKKVDAGQHIGGHELWGYLGIGSLQCVCIATGWISLVLGCLRASNMLHDRLLDSIVHAPMYFFDTTPLGRIMNRFSRDIDLLDNTMPLSMRMVLIHFSTVLFTLFIISYNTPIFLAFVVPFLVIYFCIQRYYVCTCRQLKRIESVSRSPIFTHFSETLNGVATIKAFNACERFIQESDVRVDQNFRCYYPIQVADCWLTIHVEFLANLLILVASSMSTFTKMFADEGHSLSGSEIGLSLSYALNVTLSMNFCVRVSAELENNVVSVERITEYIQVESEAPWTLPDDDRLAPEGWPHAGAILVDRYATRYRPGLDLVLKGIDLQILKGEKIGIVGRTGAGKSSLTLGIFRLIEAAEGRICIDGVDIAKLGLHKLRSRLTIIPQDPVLFSGSIRFNLDPFDQYNDQQLWNVLELSYLTKFVRSLDLGLEYVVTDGGENLSVGQRQLFCLARALLRSTNVLVLDEATAAVDFETDALIQTTIRKEFNHCTILTIAHRLHTIMDSDRVLVLDAGRVAEFDTPKRLLQNPRTIFSSLAKDAGIDHYVFDTPKSIDPCDKN